MDARAAPFETYDRWTGRRAHPRRAWRRSADVLRLKAPHRPGNFHLDIDTGHGKLTAQLDLFQAPEGGSCLVRLSLWQTGQRS
jgi:hypothetical protein